MAAAEAACRGFLGKEFDAPSWEAFSGLLDYVKLDATFLAVAASGAAGLSVNKAVVDLAKALGLAVVGQGVEDSTQVTVLSQLGCMMAQGHLLATPMALADVPARIRLAGLARTP